VHFLFCDEGYLMTRSYTKGDEPIPGYQLKNFLGRGGFGEVWRASAPGGMEAAIKIINLGDKQGLKEFRAIRLVKYVRHPNLVPINAFWLKDEDDTILGDASEEPDSLWLKAHGAELIIAMGLGDKNLYDRLKECRAEGLPGVPAEELLDYMEAAARAIDYLNQPTHKLATGPGAIQHCDIKPQNILIVGGSVQVCDFGLARVLDADARTTSEAAGSYAYIAPELIDGARPSRTTDQYSLAISYVELRTGNFPFKSSALYEVMLAKVKGKLDFSALTEPEQTVLRRATAVEPTERYGTTAEMVKALRRAVEGHASSKPPGSGGGIKSPEHLRAGAEIVPYYKLVRMLGRGGYGEVWEAIAPGGKHVALKVIGNLAAIEGKQEFKALELIKGVDHHHLMELHAYWLLDSNGDVIPDEVRGKPGAPEAVMLVIATKLANKNLLQRLRECRQANNNEGGIPLPELIRYMRQAAEAIDYLNMARHQMGDRLVSIQHRDIKPENILLAGSSIKVSDFGLAKVLEGTSAIIHGDSTGRTDAYAAPEIFSNKVTAWSDQYSLALTYYYLRTGKMPFTVSSPVEIMLVHVNGNLDLRWLPDAEREVIAKAAAVAPEMRYATCVDMVAALELATGHMRTSSDPAYFGGPGSSASDPGEEYRSGSGGSARPSRPARNDPDSHGSGGKLPGPKTFTGSETRPGSSEPRKSGPKPGPSRPVPAPEPSGYESVAFLDLKEVRPGPPDTDQVDTSTSADNYNWETYAPGSSSAPALERAPSPEHKQPSAPPGEAKSTTRGRTDKSEERVKPRTAADTGLRSRRVKKKPVANWVIPVVALGIVTMIVGAGALAIALRPPGKPQPLPTPVPGPGPGEVAKKSPSPPPPPQQQQGFDQLMEQAEGNLDTNPTRALNLFQELLERSDVKESPTFRSEVKLGMACALARNQRWQEVGQQLEEAQGLVSDQDAAVKKVLLLLATNQGSAFTPDQRKEINTCARDKGLLSRLPGWAGWEAGRLEALRGTMIAYLKAQRLKTKDPAEALKLTRELAEYEPGNTEVAKEAEVLKAIEEARIPNLPPTRISEVVKRLVGLIKPETAHVVEVCQALSALLDNCSDKGLLGNIALNAGILGGLPQEAKCQLHYVQALGFWAQDDFASAARELGEANGALAGKARCERSIDILKEAVKPLRKSDDLEKPFGDNARQAREWCALAAKLATGASMEVPLDIRKNLALAEGSEGNPRQSVDLVRSYWPSKVKALDADAGPLVLMSARELAKTDKATAVGQYAWLAERLKPSLGNRTKFETYYTKILRPAESVGSGLLRQQLTDPLKSQLASIYGAIGNTVSDNLDAGWLKKVLGGTPPREKALEKALEAYSTAYKLDDRKVEYLVGKAITQTQLPNPRWNMLLAEAEKASERNPNVPEVYNLRGYIKQQRIDSPGQAADRAASLREAVEDFDRGIALVEKNNPRSTVRSTLLTNRAIAQFQLANYTLDEQEKEKSLLGACKDAKDATNLPSSYPEYAWEALGNALEDRGMLLRDTKQYGEAVQAFGNAMNVLDQRGGDSKQPMINRGRCYYRWALATNPPELTRLSRALTDLKPVAESPEAADSERVEAYYFLGLVQQWIPKEMDKAEDSLKKALELDQKHKLGRWASYSLENLHGLRLNRRDYSGARSAAEQLAKYDAKRSRLLTATAWHAQGKLKESWESLKGELPKNLSEATTDDAELLLEAASLLTDDAFSRSNVLKDQAPTEDYAVQLADRAAQLARKSWVKAEAKGTAGSARLILANAGGTDAAALTALRNAGFADLITAINLDAGCRSVHGVEWRFLLASVMMSKGDQRQKMKYRNQMLDWLNEALKAIPLTDEERRKEVDELHTRVDNLKQ
jgi:serine/threonine protein kinase